MGNAGDVLSSFVVGCQVSVPIDVTSCGIVARFETSKEDIDRNREVRSRRRGVQPLITYHLASAILLEAALELPLFGWGHSPTVVETVRLPEVGLPLVDVYPPETES